MWEDEDVSEFLEIQERLIALKRVVLFRNEQMISAVMIEQLKAALEHRGVAYEEWVSSASELKGYTLRST